VIAVNIQKRWKIVNTGTLHWIYHLSTTAVVPSGGLNVNVTLAKSESFHLVVSISSLNLVCTLY